MSIKSARESTGMTQRAFAFRLGLKAPVFNIIETGKVNPTPQTFREMCAITGLPPSEILTSEDCDYGLLPTKDASKPKKADNRAKSSRFQTRTDEALANDFREMCSARNKCVSDMLEQLMRAEVKAYRARKRPRKASVA